MLKMILPLIAAAALISSAGATPLDDARAEIESGKWRRAEITLKGLLQEDSSAVEARQLLARIQLLRRNGAAAQIELERAISEGASEEDLLVPLARALIYQGKGERALEKIGPPDQMPADRRAELLAVRGLAELSLKDFSAAEADLKESHTLAPDGMLASYGLAQLASSQKDWKRARKLIKGMLKKHPESIEGWELLTGIEIASGRVSAALATLNRTLHRAPRSASSRLLRAQLLLDRHELDKAEKDIRALRNIVRQAPALDLLEGRLALARDQVDDGLQFIDRYLQSSPKSPLGLYLSSVGHYSQGRLAQAMEYAERLYDVAPGSEQANALLAAILLARGDTDRAERLLSHLPEQPKLALVQELRLRIAVAKGRLDEALSILDQRIAQTEADDPAHWAGRLLRLRILGANGDWKSVLEETEPMVAERPEDPLAAKMRLEAMLRTGDTEGALRAARAQAEAAPEDADARAALAKVLARSGDIGGAREAFSAALRLNPKQADAAMALAGLEAGSGNLEAAREPLEALVETSPDAIGATLGLASLDIAQGRVSAAESRLVAALKREPENLVLRLNLAAAQSRQGDTAGALRTLQDATPKQARTPALLRARGSLELTAGHPAQAVRTFEELRGQQPEVVEPILLLALAKTKADQMLGIEDLIVEALRLEGDDSPLLATTLDTVFQGLPDTVSKERFLERIARVAPSNVSYRVLAAGLALSQQDKAKAISHLRAAHATMPERRPILDKLVALLVSEQRTYEALGLLQTYVDHHPKDATAIAHLATLELQRGNEQQAIEEYRKALALDPRQPETLNNLAMLTIDEDAAGALELAREAAALKPSDWRIVDTLAITLMRNGLPQEAADAIGQARIDQPNNPTLAYRLAAALAETGEIERARKLLLEIGQRQFPERAEADALLSRLQAGGQ